MRISSQDKEKIKWKILFDLYDKIEEELASSKSKIAQKNREYYLEPYQAILKQIPEELLVRERNYIVEIKYNIDSKNSKKRLNDTWTYKSDTYITNPAADVRDKSGIFKPWKATLDCRLYVEANILAKEIISIREERMKIKKFLEDTLNKYSGANQLEKVWPQIIHRYLPPTKTYVKIKKSPTVVETEEDKIFHIITTRILTNLIQGRLNV